MNLDLNIQIPTYGEPGDEGFTRGAVEKAFPKVKATAINYMGTPNWSPPAEAEAAK